MVDVDRRLNVGQHAHVAGLKRLSARASKGPLPATASPRKGCFSFAPLAHAVKDRLRKCQVQVARGLSDEEFCRIEAPFAFTFPPDLKAILQEGLPIGAGFPDWRSGGLKQLRLMLNLPIAGLSYEVARGRFWLKQWGLKPSDTEQAVSIARAALRKAPVLIPVYRHCYIPTSPNLAGNPVFFVCQQQVFYCGFDLANFFENQGFVLPDYELPYDFVNLGAENGRASSVRSLEEQSFRLDNKLNNPLNGEIPPAYKREEGKEADSDGLEWKYEDRCGNLEGWGRNLDAMANRNGHNALSRRSFELHNRKSKAHRWFDQSIDLSNEHHANDRLASALAAKITRRIEFWSDLAEKRQNGSSDYSSSAGNGTFSFSKVGKKLNGSTDYSSPEGNGTFSSTKVEVGLDKVSCVNWKKQAPTPYWLERYFDEMAIVLRNGGWKETDITEMFDVVSPSHGSEPDLPIDSQSMMEGLVLYVNLLSDALRGAGWSTADVAEAFDVDLSFREQKRRPSTVPPHVAAKIGKLAEYAARI